MALSSQLNSAPVANQDPEDSGQREMENDLLLKTRVMRRSRLYLDIGSYNKIHNCYCFITAFNADSSSDKNTLLNSSAPKVYLHLHFQRDVSSQHNSCSFLVKTFN